MDFKIDDETRLNFNNMLKESGTQDNTEKIRKLKHSGKIREQITIMMNLRNRYSRIGKKALNAMIDSKCNWLFVHYTNIFNKLNEYGPKILLGLILLSVLTQGRISILTWIIKTPAALIVEGFSIIAEKLLFFL